MKDNKNQSPDMNFECITKFKKEMKHKRKIRIQILSTLKETKGKSFHLQWYQLQHHYLSGDIWATCQDLNKIFKTKAKHDLQEEIQKVTSQEPTIYHQEVTDTDPRNSST